METPSQMCEGAAWSLVAGLDETAHQGAALGEHLVDVPIGAFHGVEYALDVLRGNVLVEEIAHRVDEDELRTPPVCGLFEAVGAKGQIKAGLERVPLDASEALGKALGIAMVATGADLCAAGNGVPGAVGPLDSAFARHESPLRNQKISLHISIAFPRPNVKAASGWGERWIKRIDRKTPIMGLIPKPKTVH